MKERLRELDEIQESYVREAEPITAALIDAGFDVTGIDESLNKYVPLPREAVDIFLRFLPEVETNNLCEMLVRYLGSTKVRYDGLVLARLFDTVQSDTLKWVIGDAISRSRPANLEDWLVKTLQSREHGQSRQMLCHAATKLLPRDAARNVLRECFPDLPGHAAIALGRIGGERELEFLKMENEKPHDEWTSWHRRSVKKATVSIERRLEKQRNQK